MGVPPRLQGARCWAATQVSLQSVRRGAGGGGPAQQGLALEAAGGASAGREPHCLAGAEGGAIDTARRAAPGLQGETG